MSQKNIKNLAVSTRQKLLNKAHKDQEKTLFNLFLNL